MVEEHRFAGSDTAFLMPMQARTEAAKDPDMSALVVSEETLDGGTAINEDRQQQGFAPLVLLVVSLLGVGSKQLGGAKLSSTALREKEANAMPPPPSRAQGRPT